MRPILPAIAPPSGDIDFGALHPYVTHVPQRPVTFAPSRWSLIVSG
jgi:hypothetical protein